MYKLCEERVNCAIEDECVVYVIPFVISVSVMTDVQLERVFTPSVSNPAKKYLDMNNLTIK